MKTFSQFLTEKMYGFNSRGANSPAKLMSKSVKPAKPKINLYSFDHKKEKNK